MHETTVVGWDGSDTAETALEWAIARAELQPDGMRKLILVRAVDETLPEDAARTARLPRDGARSFASSFGYEVRPDPGIVVWAAPPSRPSHREARGARGHEDLRERLT